MPPVGLQVVPGGGGARKATQREGRGLTCSCPLSRCVFILLSVAISTLSRYNLLSTETINIDLTLTVSVGLGGGRKGARGTFSISFPPLLCTPAGVGSWQHGEMGWTLLRVAR